jgi:hypothetical protein
MFVLTCIQFFHLIKCHISFCSEDEIDVFESIDKQRREEELVC